MVQARNINLRFRDGSVEDAARIADLGRQTFNEYFDQVYKRSDLEASMNRYFSVEKVAHDLANPDVDYRVAEAASGLVGYAKIGPVSLPVDQEKLAHALQLHRLYVKATRQGVGVGGILLSWAIDRANERGADALMLGVWSQNQRAIAVYESRGFVPDKNYEISVGDTRDEELMMTLVLEAKTSARLTA